MSDSSGMRTVNWQRAIIAGVVATIIITITMWISGTNIISGLGMMILGAGSGQAAQYILLVL